LIIRLSPTATRPPLVSIAPRPVVSTAGSGLPCAAVNDVGAAKVVAKSVMSLILVICRLCDPSSELRIAEHLYQRSAMPDLLGVAAEKINDDRLYRALDELLMHKEELEKHLKNRLGELFDLSYDLLLYDMTSTYFEGQCAGNEQHPRRNGTRPLSN